MADYERIVLSVCRDLGIDVGRPGPSQLELRIPAPLRRLFYNRAIIRLTTMPEQKRADTDLEFLGPGCSVLECLEAAARARGGGGFEAVAGPPSRVSAREYLAAFDAKHVNVEGRKDATGQLPRGLHSVGGEIVATFESYLRAVIEMRVDGPRPLHEVFPVVVRIRDGVVVPARALSDAPLYPLDEQPGTEAERPERVPAEVVLRCIDSVYREARARATALAGVAAGAAAESVATALEEIEKYYSDQASADPANRADYREAYERQCAAARSRGDVSARLAAVTMGVIHEVHPKLRVSLQDRVARVHILDVPCVRGRPLIRDDVVSCGHFGRNLTYVPVRGLCCIECAPECTCCGLGIITPGCSTCTALGRKSCNLCISETCNVCDEPICSAHTRRSASGRGICAKCVVQCAQDGITFGTDEAWRCGSPGHSAPGVFCAAHLRDISCNHGRACASHARTSSIGEAMYCDACIRCCEVCKRSIGEPQTVNCYWKGCSARICDEDAAAAQCAVCEKPTCPNHARNCEITGSRCCASDMRTCGTCARMTRVDEVRSCEVCRASLCRDCRKDSGTGGALCAGCGGACAEDGVFWPRTRLAACDSETGELRYCDKHLRRVDCCGQTLCAAHQSRVACEHESSCRLHSIATAPEEELHCVLCVVDCLPCARPVPRSRALPCKHADCSSRICRTHAESALCVVCQLPSCQRHLLRCSETSDLACEAHAAPCATCSKIVLYDALKECGACGSECCASCILETATGRWACSDCFGVCSVDGAIWFTRELLSCKGDQESRQLCENHRIKVACCGAVLCDDHALKVACPHGFACKKHAVETVNGGLPLCTLCVGTCPDCTAPVPSVDLSRCVAPMCRVQLCGPHSSEATCLDCFGVVCAEHRVYCTGEDGLCCPSHVLACELCKRTHPASRVSPCTSCGRRACHACAVSTAGGELGCSECIELCSTGGEVHLRRDLVKCAEDTSPHWICSVHGSKLACCTRSACPTHVLECKSTGVKLCKRDAAVCTACCGTLAATAGHPCGCGARYCGICSKEVRCSTGSEVLCPVHVMLSTESGATTCADHSVPCGVCGGRLRVDEGNSCEGGERICSADAFACAHCSIPICVTHTHTLDDGERRCARCVRRCRDCPPQSLRPVECSTSCISCGKDVCQSHGAACRKHGQALCRGCARSSPFHIGSFCESDLARCSCCAVDTVVDPSNGLCDLCTLFVDPAPAPMALPFSSDVVKRFVRERAGVRIGSGNPKWRVGEKAVLLWVRSPILRRNTCAFFDLRGKELGIGTPSPERAL